MTVALGHCVTQVQACATLHRAKLDSVYLFIRLLLLSSSSSLLLLRVPEERDKLRSSGFSINAGAKQFGPNYSCQRQESRAHRWRYLAVAARDSLKLVLLEAVAALAPNFENLSVLIGHDEREIASSEARQASEH